MREGMGEVVQAKSGTLPTLLENSDLKGILHNHSTYSDGKHSLRQMAEHCKALGYEYLGISDHSRTASYAGGLEIEKVAKQQAEIELLNQELAPFRIYKGIESDILPDGSLDYPAEVLRSFDFIVSSVHSVLNMDLKRATDRLLTAIHNPYTTILGHPTGRLLLRREGYPIDHKAIIDACAEKQVVIEMWYVNSLVDQKQERPPVRWVGVGYSARNRLVFCATKFGVIGFNMDGSIIVLEDVSMTTQYTGVSMRIKF